MKQALLRLTLAAASLTASHAFAAAQLTAPAMKEVLAKVLTEANDRLEATHLQGKPKGVTGLQMSSAEGGGTWTMQLLAWGQAGGVFGDQVPMQRLPAVIKNHGSQAEFYALGPSIPIAALNALEKKGKMAKAMQDMVKERNRAKIKFGREEGRLSVHAVLPYGKDQGEVAEDLADLITDTRGIFIEALWNVDQGLKQGKKDLLDAPAQGLSPEELVLILDDGWDGMPVQALDDGTRYLYQDRSGQSYDLLFLKDLVLARSAAASDAAAGASRVKAWVAKNPFGEPMADAHVHPRFPDSWVRITLNLPLDGSLSGAQLKEKYHRFMNGYAGKALDNL